MSDRLVAIIIVVMFAVVLGGLILWDEWRNREHRGKRE